MAENKPNAQMLSSKYYSMVKGIEGFLLMVDVTSGQEKYKMSLGYLVMTKSKKVLKKGWRHLEETQEPTLRGSK